MSSIDRTLCQAIDIIVNKAISEAAYDKTIQATIVKCVDATIGKYTVKYQDSTFYAYSNNPEVTYVEGTNVYILIPANDMGKDKTILGTSKKLGINYISTVEKGYSYNPYGTNCLGSGEFCLKSYAGPQELVLYQYDQINNLINLDLSATNEYLKSCGYIICAGKFRTELPSEQQFSGNFGIIYALDFMDNATQKEITRYYTIDIDKMLGNPYKQIKETRQYGIFEIDNVNFIRVNNIKLFSYNFPNIIDGKPNDIFIKDLELFGAEKLSQDDLNNYAITISTPKGTFFDDTSDSTDEIILKAEVRVKGRVIDENSQKLPYYWFIQNASVVTRSRNYNKYGGRGWKCLNDSTIVGEEEVEWIPASSKFSIKKEDLIAKQATYKCVAVYGTSIISKTIIIKNLSSSFDISIESSDGNKFFFDIGRTNLTCLVNNAENLNFQYIWSVTDNTGTTELLEETAELNDHYAEAFEDYNILSESIERGLLLKEANKSLLQEKKDIFDELDSKRRVYKNKIFNIYANTITNFVEYQCSVFRGDGVYIGTAAYQITNSLDQERECSVVINNGTYVFKYDEEGDSPTGSAPGVPLEIKALTFTIYNELGEAIDDEITRHCEIRWLIPKKNSLLRLVGESNPEVDPKTEKYIIRNRMSLSYGIAGKYDVLDSDNTIRVEVNYKGKWIYADTNLTFLKEGESGTNGTKYVCKIVPNVATGVMPPQNPMISYVGGNGGRFNFTHVGNSYFRAELWEDGERIFSGSQTSGKFVITWSILKNTDDISTFKINATNANITNFGYYTKERPANIIEVCITYEEKKYYATLPIITAKMNNGYDIKLKDGTGFKQALYTTSGIRPQYSKIPFELVIHQMINGNNEDISNVINGNKLKYTWNLLGSINKLYLTKRGVWNEADGPESSAKIEPVSNFDGYCKTNAVEVGITQNGIEIGRIHIPVHLLLNRYGLAAINEWNGNSVSIKNDKGVILSPQVGAGKKDSSNNFTGILIGSTIEADDPTEHTGLLGYGNGERTIFLDAETGKAEFGKNNGGKIIIDPTNNTADIKSGNYAEGSNGSGMLIDLTTPQIKFGSGNFAVDQNGKLIAKVGEIGSGSTKIIIGGNATYGAIYSGSHSTYESTNAGFYLGPNGFSLGSAFRVSNTGVLTATSGKIGNWEIGASTLTGGNTVLNSSGAMSGKDWSITSGGLATFTNVKISNGQSNSELDWGNGFKVSTGGKLTATGVDLTGAITATSGKIADCVINSNGLNVSGGLILNNNKVSWTYNAPYIISIDSIVTTDLNIIVYDSISTTKEDGYLTSAKLDHSTTYKAVSRVSLGYTKGTMNILGNVNKGSFNVKSSSGVIPND